MKIRKVTASDFGCLSGSYDLYDDRANVIVELNERGKSTLVAAILTGLYGLPERREKKTLPEKDIYQPWKGGSYRVGLEVEDNGGRPLQIERDLGEGNVRVTDLSTNKDVTQEFLAGKRDFAIGDRLLGVSREVFLKTCLVRQLYIDKLDDAKDVQSKVEAIFDTSGGKGTAAEAIGVLQEAVEGYRGTLLKSGKVETEIRRLREEIGGREARMGELTAERERVAPSMARLRELRNRMKELEAARLQLEYLSRKAEISEIESALKEDEKNRRELDELVRRKESLKPYGDFTGEQASEFSQLAGRVDQLRKRRKQLAESLDKLKSGLEGTKKKLSEFEGFEALDEDFKTRLHDLSTGLKRLGEDVENRRRQLSGFQESLKKDGYDLAEIDELSRRFSNVSVEDNDLLRRSEARIPEIKAEVIQLESAEGKCREQLQAIRKPGKVLLPVGGVLCLAGITSMLLSAVGIGGAMVAAGAATLAFALLLLPRLNMHRIQKCIGEEAGARERRESLLSERDEITQKLQEMAPNVGFETVAELSEAFRRWGRLEGRARRLESLRKDVGEAEIQRASARRRSSDGLKKMGLDVARAEVTVVLLEKAERRVGEYLETVSSVNQLEEGRRKVEADIEEVEREGKGLRESIRSILVAAKLPQDLPVEEAAPKVEEARKKGEESRRLSVEIPERERKLLPPEKTTQQKKRLESLKAEIERMVAEGPDLETVQPTKKHSEYEEKARQVAKKGSENTDERGKILREVESVEERYHKEYPRLANELAELKETLDKTERFHKSVSLAIETLQKISAESHAQWAGTLNPRANEILRHLNPRCRELKFDRDLSFTVVPVEGEEPKDQRHIDDQQSVGAKHQIYLAVRLALADYLSSAGKIPVILDDPFATSDDDRFLSGMKFVCREFRKNHQVIILTCHRQRHVDLIRDRAPDTLDEIRFIELTPSGC